MWRVTQGSKGKTVGCSCHWQYRANFRQWKKSLKLNVFTNEELSAAKDESMMNHCFK
jgi:hypothetical protein